MPKPMPKPEPAQRGAGNVSGRMSSPAPTPNPKPSPPLSLKTVRDALPDDILGKIVGISRKQFKAMENPLNHPDLLEFGETIKKDERIPRLASNSIYDLETLVTLPPGKKYEVRVRINGVSPNSSRVFVSMYRKSLIGDSLKKIAVYEFLCSGQLITSKLRLDSKISEVEERAFYSVYAHVAKALRNLPMPALKFPEDADYVKFDSDGWYIKKFVKYVPFKSRVSELYTTPKSTLYLRERSVARSAFKQAPAQAQRGAGNVSGNALSQSHMALTTIRDALPNDILGEIVKISEKKFKNPLNHPDLLEFGEAITSDKRIANLIESGEAIKKGESFAHLASISIYDFEATVTLPPGKKYNIHVSIVGTSPTSSKVYIFMHRKSPIGGSLKKIAAYTIINSETLNKSEVLLDSKISEVEERAFYSVYAHVAKVLRHLPMPALLFPKDTDYVKFNSEGYVKGFTKEAPFKSRVSELYTVPKSLRYLHERSIARSASKPTPSATPGAR